MLRTSTIEELRLQLLWFFRRSFMVILMATLPDGVAWLETLFLLLVVLWGRSQTLLLQLGQTIGGYRIQSLLGKGAMGEVYSAAVKFRP